MLGQGLVAFLMSNIPFAVVTTHFMLYALMIDHVICARAGTSKLDVHIMSNLTMILETSLLRYAAQTRDLETVVSSQEAIVSDDMATALCDANEMVLSLRSANETLAEELDALRASNDALGAQVTALCDAKTVLTEELATAKRELADARDVLVAEVEVESFEDRQAARQMAVLAESDDEEEGDEGKTEEFSMGDEG